MIVNKGKASNTTKKLLWGFFFFFRFFFFGLLCMAIPLVCKSELLR